MPLCRFLCLALSRRDGGYCAAGLDLDTGLWIRPLNPRTRALHEADIFLRDTASSAVRPIRLFDIVALPLDRAIPTSTQPENWLLQTLPPNVFPQLLGNAQQNRSVLQRLLGIAAASASHPFLFGNAQTSIAHQHLLDSPLPFSLSLIRPLDLVWMRSTDYHGRPRMLAEFCYGLPRQRYCLSVTDNEYERRLLNATVQGSRRLPAKELQSEQVSEVLLAASLGENFTPKNRHYKLIAGVLEMPK